MLSEEYVEYKLGDDVFEAFVAYPKQHNASIIILAHAWAGRDDFICDAARRVTSWGYIGFAWDIYGKGVLGQSAEENSRLKKPYMDDRNLLRERILGAYAIAKGLTHFPNINVMGFGFGGLCALDLLRTRVPLKGVVSVYGHFTPTEWTQQAHNPAKVLILHGYEDAVEPVSHLEAFAAEMKANNVEWQAHLYGETTHAFMNPQVILPEKGLCYNKDAADAAWRDAQIFFSEQL